MQTISHFLWTQSVFKNHYCASLISHHTEMAVNVLDKDDKCYWDTDWKLYLWSSKEQLRTVVQPKWLWPSSVLGLQVNWSFKGIDSIYPSIPKAINVPNHGFEGGCSELCSVEADVDIWDIYIWWKWQGGKQLGRHLKLGGLVSHG